MKILAVIAISLIATISNAAENVRPYCAVLTATTLAYRDHGGKVTGPPQDVSTIVGGGYLFNDTLSVELDMSLTFDNGKFVSFGYVPSVTLNLNSYLYSTSRFLISVDPFGLTWIPGVGVTYVFDSGFAPFAELELLVGTPGVNFRQVYTGLAFASGVLYMF